MVPAHHGYADELLNSLDTLDWSEHERHAAQLDRQGEGASVHFQLQDHDAQIEVFTTRPDTIFGANFMVLAPEH